MAKIREHVILCAAKVPWSFEGSLKAAYSHYRAVDWQLFLLVVIPNIVLPFFVEDDAKNALMNLIIRMDIFTSNVRSTTRPGVNSSNILSDRANSNQYGIQEIINDMGEPSSTTDATTFLELPNNEGTFPQLWDPNQNQSIFGDGEVMAGLSDGALVSAIRSYYHRLYPDQQVQSINNTIRLTGRMWSDSNIYSSKLYREQHHSTTSADNFVLFEAGRNGRIYKCWFVGEVYTYFEHIYNEERRFIAVVNVMQKHEFGYYSIPMVTEDPHHPHFAVLNVGDVLHDVGFFQHI
ncbi:hypothetical protein G6F56_010284 [Rhizopus delemar]|nr:hypothetical protein G6F56_010284 [Rhizopus delemar]